MASNRAEQWGRHILEVPDLSHRVLRQLSEGQLETSVRWEDGRAEFHHLSQALGAISRSIYVVGLTIAGALLQRGAEARVGMVCWGLAALITLVGIFHRSNR